MNPITFIATLGFTPESPWDSRRQSVTSRLAATWIVASLFLLAALLAHAAPWGGFADRSTNLMTFTFSFTGTTNPAAGDSNENYYDGDMGDFDGDGWMDRALIARYGLLLNTGGGFMTPAANTIVGGTYRFGDKDGVGNDAAQWADVDNDGDLDIIQGGNGEILTLQINAGLGRFTTKPIPSVSALNIVNIDLERDGDVDLAIAHAFCSDVQCGHGCPDTNCAGNWPKQFALFLNDGDGDLDLVCALDRDTAGSPHPRVAHAIFINDGNGNFVEETATRFIVAGTNFYAGGNGKLMDIDYDGDLDFFAFDAKTRHFQV